MFSFVFGLCPFTWNKFLLLINYIYIYKSVWWHQCVVLCYPASLACVHFWLCSTLIYCVVYWLNLNFGFVPTDCRKQKKTTAHQYHCSLLWCNESWWCCQESIKWHKIWLLYYSLQHWGSVTVYSDSWFIASEVISDGFCRGYCCWYNSFCSSVLPVELVWKYREVARTNKE